MNNKSHLTAITRKKPSAPMRALESLNLLQGKNMLDYGSGRGFDASYYGMDAYDPHYCNRGDLCLEDYDVITCNYVLNVIEDEREREKVLEDIEDLLLPGGKAYITVRRDVKSTGYTKRGTYQENIQLKLPILKETSGYCIYVLTK